jgi:hypothetical protein
MSIASVGLQQQLDFRQLNDSAFSHVATVMLSLLHGFVATVEGKKLEKCEKEALRKDV